MQEALTFQVPTTLPPHAVTFEQEAPGAPPPGPVSPPLPAVLETPEAPPLLAIPPPLLAIPPPLLPGVPALPAVPFEPPAHAPEITATAAAITKAADRIFIEGVVGCEFIWIVAFFEERTGCSSLFRGAAGAALLSGDQGWCTGALCALAKVRSSAPPAPGVRYCP
jgi:hypothetical protein